MGKIEEIKNLMVNKGLKLHKSETKDHIEKGE
jgi:hypothetical protein